MYLVRKVLMQGFRFFDSLVVIVFSFELDHDTSILKTAVCDKVDNIEIKTSTSPDVVYLYV